MTRRTATRTPAVVVAVVLSLATGAPPIRADVRIDRNRVLGSSVGEARGRDVPGLAADPADARHAVEVEEEFLTGECAYHVTFDAGATWTRGVLRGPDGYPPTLCHRFDRGGYSHSNGAVAFGAGQNVFTAFTAGRPGRGETILVARSEDGGRTFAPGVEVVPAAADPNITLTYRPQISTQGDKVMVSSRSSDAIVVPGAVGVSYYSQAVASNDGGVTWRAPVRFTRPTDGQAGGNNFSQPAYTPDGKVHIAYARTGVGPAQSSLVLATSADNGGTWTHSDIGSPAGLTGPKLISAADGALVLAYQGTGPKADPDILVQRRPAGATAWTPQVRVNDDTAPGPAEQRFPWLTRSAGGRIDIVWHDRRHRYPVPNVRMEDYYLASSHDGGATFEPNRRVTDRSINLDVGLDRRVGTTSFYWPAAAALADGRLMVAWPDSRFGNFDTDTQDVLFTTVETAPSGVSPVQVLEGGRGLDARLGLLAYPGGKEGVTPPSGGAPVAASRVVVVGGDDVAAALAGAVAARSAFGPLLRTSDGGLPDQSRGEVARMRPVGATIIGNEAAVPAAVIDELVAAGVPRDKVTRLSASDAPSLARAVAESLDLRTNEQKSSATPAFDAVVIANPDSADAPAAAHLAASQRLPFLYVERDAVPAATADALKGLAIKKTLVIGGPEVITDAVLASLPGARRVGGGGVAATSRAVLAESKELGLPRNVAYVADARRPMEVAVLSAAVARLGGLLVLTEGADVAAARSALDAAGVGGSLDRLVVLATGATAPATNAAGAGAGAGTLPATGASGPGASSAASVLAVLLGVLVLRRRLTARP